MLGISYGVSAVIEFSKIKKSYQNVSGYSSTGEILLFMGSFVSTAI